MIGPDVYQAALGICNLAAVQRRQSAAQDVAMHQARLQSQFFSQCSNAYHRMQYKEQDEHMERRERALQQAIQRAVDQSMREQGTYFNIPRQYAPPPFITRGRSAAADDLSRIFAFARDPLWWMAAMCSVGAWLNALVFL